MAGHPFRPYLPGSMPKGPDQWIGRCGLQEKVHATSGTDVRSPSPPESKASGRIRSTPRPVRMSVPRPAGGAGWGRRWRARQDGGGGSPPVGAARDGCAHAPDAAGAAGGRIRIRDHCHDGTAPGRLPASEPARANLPGVRSYRMRTRRCGGRAGFCGRFNLQTPSGARKRVSCSGFDARGGDCGAAGGAAVDGAAGRTDRGGRAELPDRRRAPPLTGRCGRLPPV